MLEINKERKLIGSDKSAVLSIKKVNELFNRMVILLNHHTSTSLKRVINLKKSVFKEAYFVETFKGETIKIANYNVYNKTIEFANEFFSKKSKKYVIETKNLSENETVLEISFKGVSILKIKFSTFAPIEFDFLKNEFSYENLFEHYQNNMQLENGEFDEIVKAQDKLQRIVRFGPEAIEEVKGFFEGYIEAFSINLNLEHTWYKIKCHDLKNF